MSFSQSELQSSSTTITTFHAFSRLPPEVQTMIWSIAISSIPARVIHHKRQKKPDKRVHLVPTHDSKEEDGYTLTLVSLIHACSLSRRLALTPKTNGNYYAIDHFGRYYINHAIDTVRTSDTLFIRRRKNLDLKIQSLIMDIEWANPALLEGFLTPCLEVMMRTGGLKNLEIRVYAIPRVDHRRNDGDRKPIWEALQQRLLEKFTGFSYLEKFRIVFHEADEETPWPANESYLANVSFTIPHDVRYTIYISLLFSHWIHYYAYKFTAFCIFCHSHSKSTLFEFRE